MTHRLAINLTVAAILGGLFFCLLSIVPARACDKVTASWYGAESGNRTANGEHFNGTSMTCAHKTLPFGTELHLTHRGNTAICRVNDRGPFVKGRELDVSRAVAAKLGMLKAGVVKLCMEKL